MPLWDNFADQIHLLPTAAAIDPAFDRLAYAGATRSGVQTAALRAVPNSVIWMLQASGVNVSPTASSTVERDTFRSPHALTAVRFFLTVTTAYGAGTQPFFDLYNDTDTLSLLDNTSGVDAVLTLPDSTATIAIDDPVDVPSVPVNKSISLYCVTASSTNLGSTWGHLQYVI